MNKIIFTFMPLKRHWFDNFKVIKKRVLSFIHLFMYTIITLNITPLQSLNTR